MGKLLFIRGGAVGDFILTLPAIQLVRQGFPDLEIEILGYRSITELAVAAGLADRTSSIEMATMAPFFAPGASLDSQLSEYFASFDVVVSYLYDPDGFFQGNLIRAGVETLIVGPYKMDEQPDSPPAAHQLAEPLGQLALFLDEPFVEVSYGDSAKNEDPVVAIHPGSGSASKNWSFEAWAALAKQIRDKMPGTSFLIISGEAEHETISDFLSLIDHHDLDYQHLQGKDLPAVGQVLQRCDLFLGHDSGISHLAASTGIPGLVLFGPTNPSIWAPPHPSFDYIKAPRGQLGNLTVSSVWENPTFQEKLKSIS